MEPTTKRPRPLFARIAGLGLGALTLLVVGVFAIAFLNTSAIADYVTGRMLPEVSRRIGREVQIDRVEAKVFPRPGAALHGFRIAGAKGEPTFVTAEEATAEVELWQIGRASCRERVCLAV